MNGNYVVVSSDWGGVGAVTWGSGTAGVSGTVSDVNSLVGSRAGDQVGNYDVTPWPAATTWLPARTGTAVKWMVVGRPHGAAAPPA